MLAAPLASPRPRSEAQRAAARVNGARSRGPSSAAGRARAARNALRHGLCSATTVVAPGEDPAAFEALLADLRAEHRPADVTADQLVQRLAATFWKLARCDRLEAGLAACRPRPPAGRLYPDGTPVLLTRVAELAALARHQAQLDRTLHRLLKALATAPARAPDDPDDLAADRPGRAERQSEPEPARPAPAEPGLGESPNEPEPAPEPDPEALLLARAGAEPGLALALAERLAEDGDLARLAHLARHLGPALAAAGGRSA